MNDEFIRIPTNGDSKNFKFESAKINDSLVGDDFETS